jgi:aminoglycoside phosphotransferase family enzyme/predicted kinase
MRGGGTIKSSTAESRQTVEPLELLETCFALLYQGPSEVFKVRKPLVLRLSNEVIDLSSIDRRHAACLEEEKLARLLAPDVPLGVIPVSLEPDGGLRLEGPEPNDWALRMRRLPAAHRADRRLAEGSLTDDHLRLVADRLAAFHKGARAVENQGEANVITPLRHHVELRIEAPTWPRRTPLPEEVEEIEAWQLGFLDAEADRFRHRASTRSIREGHGGLSLDHLFFDDDYDNGGRKGVRILPGLEVGPRFREADVAADIALLATDIAARHRVDLAERFVAEYARAANDFDLYPLLDFYSSLRACIRGKLDWLCADHFGSEPNREHTHRERARRFFALALAAPRRPLLPAAVVAIGGQVASGKSTLAEHIARRIGAPVVSSDATRDFLLGAGVGVDSDGDLDIHEVHWEEAYETGFARRVYTEVLRRASEVLTSGRPVVIDGCFRSREQRAQARDLARRCGRPFLFVEAEVDEPLQLERLTERAVRDGVPIEAWKEIADQLRAGWEPATELPSNEHLPLNTARSLDQNAESIETRLPTWPSGFTG